MFSNTVWERWFKVFWTWWLFPVDQRVLFHMNKLLKHSFKKTKNSAKTSWLKSWTWWYVVVMNLKRVLNDRNTLRVEGSKEKVWVMQEYFIARNNWGVKVDFESLSRLQNSRNIWCQTLSIEHEADMRCPVYGVITEHCCWIIKHVSSFQQFFLCIKGGLYAVMIIRRVCQGFVTDPREPGSPISFKLFHCWILWSFRPFNCSTLGIEFS